MSPRRLPHRRKAAARGQVQSLGITELTLTTDVTVTMEDVSGMNVPKTARHGHMMMATVSVILALPRGTTTPAEDATAFLWERLRMERP